MIELPPLGKLEIFNDLTNESNTKIVAWGWGQFLSHPSWQTSIVFFIDDVPTSSVFKNTIRATPESVPIFFCCNQHRCFSNFIFSNSTITYWHGVFKISREHSTELLKKFLFFSQRNLLYNVIMKCCLPKNIAVRHQVSIPQWFWRSILRIPPIDIIISLS